MNRMLLIIFIFLLASCGTKQLEKEPTAKEQEQVFFPQTTYISSQYLQTTQLSVATLENLQNIDSDFFDEVKEIKEGIFQGVKTDYTSEVNQISFYTWKKDGQVELLDVKNYNSVDMKYGFDAGLFYLQLWKEFEMFYLSYHDYEVSSSFLEKGLTGKLPSSPIMIGMSEADLLALFGEPTVTDWYEGGRLYSYSDMVYILDDQKIVRAINMPGNRIKCVLDELPLKIGNPTSVEISSIDESVAYVYSVGNYSLRFEADHEKAKINDIWLYEY